MKNLKTIVLGIFIVSAITINIFQPFKNNVAIACNPWDPDYNILTGECDLPPSGEAEVTGTACWIWMWDGYEMVVHYTGTYATDCEWAVVGSCTPISCP